MTLARKSVFVGVVTALVAPLIAATGSFAATSVLTKVYPTKIANVHVRSKPSNASGSKVVATLATAGTKVAVTCVVHVISGGTTHNWYLASKPVGYVAGRNLVLPKHQVTGLPTC